MEKQKCAEVENEDGYKKRKILMDGHANEDTHNAQLVIKHYESKQPNLMNIFIKKKQ